MKVAIFGSWYDRESAKEWHFKGSRDVFNDACRDIGRALADAGHTLIVESEKQEVADPHVVGGYLEKASPSTLGDLRIELAYPRESEEHQRPFDVLATAHPRLFKYDRLPASETERQRLRNSHLVSLKKADAILTIGGQQGTDLAGYAAIVANKLLVPIASFGGASARLLTDLKNELGGSLTPAYEELFGPWTQNTLKRALELLGGDISKVMIFISHAHEDEDLARAIVEVIKEAFDISDDAIRCTSVARYTLPAGIHTANQLRSEIEKTEFVLGVLTPRSIKSRYVLLELGAAWGLGKRTFPLVAGGVPPSDIPGLLGELNWLDLADSKKCYQLIDSLSSFGPMGNRRKKGSLASVASAVEQLVSCAQKEPPEL